MRQILASFLAAQRTIVFAFLALICIDGNRGVTLINDAASPGAVVRIAFISASGVLSVIMIGGTAQGINGLFLVVAVQLAALLASYILAERRLAVASGEGDFHATAHSMAKAAAHDLLLSLISGRPGPNQREGR